MEEAFRFTTREQAEEELVRIQNAGEDAEIIEFAGSPPYFVIQRKDGAVFIKGWAGPELE